MKLVALALAAMFTLATVALAQTPESNATINQRKANQQKRIAQGVQSGQMTKGEAHHVEHQERAINHEERNMRAADNGHLTSGDRKAIAAQQNKESSRIARDKHNAAVR